MHAWALACLLVAWPRRATADEHAYAVLRYELDDPGRQCGDEAAFRARVTSRLGYDPFRDEADLELRVRVVVRPRAVRATIDSARRGRPSGTRSIDDVQCDALVETVASAVALVLDPVGAAPHSEVAALPLPPLPLPPPPSAPKPLVSSGRDAPPTPAPATQLAPLAYLDGTASFGRAPVVLLGVRFGAGVSSRSFSAAAEAHAETSSHAAGVTATDRLSVSAFSGSLVPCGTIRPLQLCGVLTLGTRQTTAPDVEVPTTRGALFSALGIRAGIELPLTAAVALRLNGDVRAALLRTTYTVDRSPVFTPAPVDVGVGIGVLGRFQ